MAKQKPKDMHVTKELGDVHYMTGEFKLRAGDFASAQNISRRAATLASHS